MNYDNFLTKPIMMMTGSEFLELLKMASEGHNSDVKDFTEKKYVYGINGLANLLGCGRTKAQEIKSSGQIDQAIYQSGKTIVIDSEKALQLLKTNRI